MSKHDKIFAYLRDLTTDQLKALVQPLFYDDRDEADVVLDHVLKELDRRLPEKEFVQLCDSTA